MKKFLFLTITAVSLSLGSGQALAQMGMGGGGQGPQFDSAMNKLYGDVKSFTATLEIQTTGNDTNTVSMPGAYNFDSGKSRFEVKLTDVKGSMISPDAAAQMTAMGMGTTVAISRPDLKLNYIVYPGLNSYALLVSQDASASVRPEDYKMEAVADGKETVDGHDCVKNKVTLTDKAGNKHEFTVWNATDLQKFPVKVMTGEGGRPVTMLYKNVSLTKPDAGLFEAPAGFTKYHDVQTMLQAEMMKKMGGGAKPPGQ